MKLDARQRLVWRMEKPCADCPFSNSAKGRFMRQSLRPGRIETIEKALRKDSHFICHKTTFHTGNNTNLVCAGALAWQHRRGLSSQYERICERLNASKARTG